MTLAAVPGVRAAANNPVAGSQPSVSVDTLNISTVEAAYPVGFALLTHPPFQFAAYYDAHHQLTVAQRLLSERQWTCTQLPDVTGWDSHNSIALTADDDGFLHLSGDMHVIPLKYYRSTRPWDASTLVRVTPMVGPNEQSATYPQFIRGPKNELIFIYRDGGSGCGNQIYNAYDLKTKTWHRLLDTPLTDGEGHRNAYCAGPVKGPDGWFHLAWVWRESPDAASNHDLSYARSRDLIHWQNAAGQPLKLPITLASPDLVDPVPEKGGIINGETKIGFDGQNRVTISYFKYDAAGYTQPWTARLENGHWKFYQITHWPYRWDFGGGGSLASEIHLGSVHLEKDGRLTQSFNHIKFGSGTWLIDPETLRANGLARLPLFGRVIDANG